MPNYWNPNNFYPTTYANQMGYSGLPTQQPQMNVSQMQNTYAMAWVDGEIEARGRQMPQGVTQFAMWDANQPKIYLKSLNQMGIPNPMQVLHYTIEEAQANLPAGQSGSAGNTMPDMSQYVTKQDFEQLKNELRQMNQSGSNYNNRSGNSNNTSGNNNQNRGVGG